MQLRNIRCAAAGAVGAGANLLKQNQIFPPPPSSSEDPGKKGRGQAWGNFFLPLIQRHCMHTPTEIFRDLLSNKSYCVQV